MFSINPVPSDQSCLTSRHIRGKSQTELDECRERASHARTEHAARAGLAGARVYHCTIFFLSGFPVATFRPCKVVRLSPARHRTPADLLPATVTQLRDRHNNLSQKKLIDFNDIM